MLRSAIPAPIALALIALAISGRGYAGHSPPAALALAPSLSVAECVEVNAGDTFTVAISVAGVTNLLAWDVYYAYDRNILEVVGRNVRQFLDKEPNSNVFDLSDPLPNTNGLYRIGAADTGGPGTEEDGSGVLALITLKARSRGLSWSSLGPFDANADGAADLGPTLTETGGGHISDANSDGIFDGPIAAGRIAVDRPCSGPLPTPFVDDSVVIRPAVKSPSVATVTPTPTRRPDGSTPEPDDPIVTPAPSSPTGNGAVNGAPSGSPTPTERGGSTPGGESDNSGGVSPVLAALVGAVGGAGILGSYLILRAVRRPA